MTEAKKILELIEAVDPQDSEALDEIDKLADTYVHGPQPEPPYIRLAFYSYCRSRDALKAIRPEGWRFQVNYRGGTRLNEIEFYVHARYLNHTDRTVGGHTLPTEELAELHAIIQAIAYERETK